MEFPTRIDYYISRVLHMLSASLLVGGSAVPFLYKDPQPLYPQFFAIAAVVAFLTGIYNAVALQPAKMKEKATLWKIITYGGKTAIFVLTTPLLEKIFGTKASLVRLILVILAVGLGSYCRYYREKNQAPKP